MTDAFDQRIVQVGIQIKGELLLYEGVDIRASGIKTISPQQNQCNIRITNLTREHRNELLTKATPLNVPGKDRQPISITLDVGRESYGTFRLFEGDAWAMGATQPPDIGITLEGLANNAFMGLISSTSFSAMVPLKTIAQKIADQNHLTLDYQATTDKQISNYHYTGAVWKQVQKLSEMGDVIAYADGGKLFVRDATPKDDSKAPLLLIDETTGLIGTPQLNMAGVIVRVLASGAYKMGSQVQIQSEINPGANGIYTVWGINFDIANRDAPFWFTMFCKNNAFFGGSGA